MGILKGDEAYDYLYGVLTKGDFSLYEIPSADESMVDNHFNSLFLEGTPTTNTKKTTFSNPSYRVIDSYSLFSNNCVTKTVEGLSAGFFDIDKTIIGPDYLSGELYKENNSAVYIENPVEFLKELLSQWQTIRNY